MGCLMRWEHQPEKRSLMWRLAISNLRNQMESTLQENESDLMDRLDLNAVYRQLKPAIAREARTQVPDSCPYSVDDLVDPYFWPNE
ncbi:protein of unknown function DUF29 [Magnetococcus marinus MC-1]|uniref:Uncharacterized protein n=2 Tax=Magnetococcus TaxID=162171 RepID=A0L435_MAGMM|nr:protein of unknown function DUF29 [Magnetococcus marinus MC-1]